jgi:hypothetical protein
VSETLVKAPIIAQIGHETWELGSGMIGEADPVGELRRLAAHCRR